MEIFKKYWWVLLIIALLIAAWIFRNQIMVLFGGPVARQAGTNVPQSESCASAQRIVQRATLKEGEDVCPKPLYLLSTKSKERYWTKGSNWFDSCMDIVRKDIDGSGPWYFNYEKGDRCYYTNDISNPLS